VSSVVPLLLLRSFHNIPSSPMPGMALKTLALALVATFALLDEADANTVFLQVKNNTGEDRISMEEIQTSLLSEVEGAFGSATTRVKEIEDQLAPMYAALPKNAHGKLGHTTVRYALHRLFVQRHGWFVKGLHGTMGSNRSNVSSTVGLLKEQVPAYIQGLFEQRLNGTGFGIHEMSVLAATIEHLVHNEAVKRLSDALRLQNLLPTDMLTLDQVESALDMYMAAYIIGENLGNMTYDQAMWMLEDMPYVCAAWNDTQEFVRSVRRKITESDSSADQKASGTFDFAIVARMAVRIGEQFGIFQDKKCQQMKEGLLEFEDKMPGRVRLSRFWKSALDGEWQFQESKGYLKQLGALDESNLENPRVIIPNYMSSTSNCLASSSFYSVCCHDECEGLMGHLEQEIAAPEANAERIIDLVSKLSSTTVAAPRTLSQDLILKLNQIAIEHGGTVQIHGRLFSQWMHHAFPRDCPYPHVTGTTNPLTPDEWLAATGEEGVASHEEIKHHIEKNLNNPNSFEEDPLPWVHEEELLFHRPARAQKPFETTPFVRNGVIFSALAAFAFSILKFAVSLSKEGPGKKHEKHLV